MDDKVEAPDAPATIPAPPELFDVEGCTVTADVVAEVGLADMQWYLLHGGANNYVAYAAS